MPGAFVIPVAAMKNDGATMRAIFTRPSRLPGGQARAGRPGA